MYHHSTTDIQRDNLVYERNGLQLYQPFLQLLLQLAQREVTVINRTSHLRILVVYEWLRVVASGLRYLRIVTSYLQKNQSVDNRRRLLTCQKRCLSFHGSVTVSASCDELFTDTSELSIRKDS